MRLVREGHRVVMTGSAAEFRRCRYIAKAAHLPIDCVLAGNTGLERPNLHHRLVPCSCVR